MEVVLNQSIPLTVQYSGVTKTIKWTLNPQPQLFRDIIDMPMPEELEYMADKNSKTMPYEYKDAPYSQTADGRRVCCVHNIHT